ncbi:MAG: hypothetical protein V3T86_16135 [Planctomycetota bacterium]
MQVDARREHEDELLRGYHDALGRRDYSFDEFQRDVRRALQVLYGALVNGIAHIDPKSCHPRQTEWIDSALGGPVFAAVQDHALDRDS